MSEGFSWKRCRRCPNCRKVTWKLFQSCVEVCDKFEIRLKSNAGICPLVPIVFLNCKTETGKILPFIENGRTLHWKKIPERLLGMNKHWSAGGELSGYQLFIHVQILCVTCTPLGTTISKPGFLFVIYDKKKSKLNVVVTKFLDLYMG